MSDADATYWLELVWEHADRGGRCRRCGVRECETSRQARYMLELGGVVDPGVRRAEA